MPLAIGGNKLWFKHPPDINWSHFSNRFQLLCSCACAHQLEEVNRIFCDAAAPPFFLSLSLSFTHISVMMKNCLLIDPFLPAFFPGYPSLHDRNDNSTPPSGQTQMSYLQMNSLRNGSNASSATPGNQTSIYPMLKEEITSSSQNSSANNYPSLSDLSVSWVGLASILRKTSQTE